MHVESAFKALTELVGDPNKSIKYAAIWSLVVVIETKPSTTEEVFIILKEVLLLIIILSLKLLRA
ncbi:hypothetical protein A3305_04575 [Rickettsia amblyommatis]|uniref:Clathrin/coatomer adaptor adaptin-like N-terminal domain-containing protein n=2 Tax=Rickettsia amblyommatis TaxID=33989 RepID=H8K4P9_RICAG|nr:hypothetical protein [Rickettsia amblyommatis]AFC69493.1 hypothetical protein MCE_02630 [Rickettsia amblyommatis str. GAT-30V]ARD87722.1 hypothetical protein A3305_04575 [Rickettsia amblyommatis]KJV61808.1 hypothetical protein APHACPA_0824 [Rickettsia amblyommatis str. Ac/Pa]KJV96910.1 hypothetical protein RAMDARK_0566 [Rickettsia amblyommatis str. Darkwater]